LAIFRNLLLRQRYANLNVWPEDVYLMNGKGDISANWIWGRFPLFYVDVQLQKDIHSRVQFSKLVLRLQFETWFSATSSRKAAQLR
jgi:hypothetical protein